MHSAFIIPIISHKKGVCAILTPWIRTTRKKEEMRRKIFNKV
jgi:hypothetical protein